MRAELRKIQAAGPGAVGVRVDKEQAVAIATKFVRKVGGPRFAKTIAEAHKEGSLWEVFVSPDPAMPGSNWYVGVYNDGTILDALYFGE